MRNCPKKQRRFVAWDWHYSTKGSISQGAAHSGESGNWLKVGAALVGIGLSMGSGSTGLSYSGLERWR